MNLYIPSKTNLTGMEIGITKMSSKGQIVIPQDMRKEFEEGEKIFLIKDKERIVLKPAKSLDKQLREDLEFARRTEEAYRRHERGGSITMSWDDFVKEFKKW